LDELVELWHQLEGQIDEGASIFDYIEVDEDVATSEESNLKKSFNASPSVSKAKMRVLVKANANILEFSNFARLFC